MRSTEGRGRLGSAGNSASPTVAASTKQVRTLLTVHPQAERHPPAASPPTAFEVRVRYTVGACVCVIGHDRRGDAMFELRIARKHLTPDIVRGVARWCRLHDPGPDLQIAR